MEMGRRAWLFIDSIIKPLMRPVLWLKSIRMRALETIRTYMMEVFNQNYWAARFSINDLVRELGISEKKVRWAIKRGERMGWGLSSLIIDVSP
jgi:hypothetical protein